MWSVAHVEAFVDSVGNYVTVMWHVCGSLRRMCVFVLFLRASLRMKQCDCIIFYLESQLIIFLHFLLQILL